ncbi:MAG: arylsulfatase [Pseudomonadota bacterium]
MSSLPRSFRHLPAGLALLFAALLASTVAARVPPNLVLILADDIGYSDFGAYGGEIETPHIDALAAAGTRFSNFRAASSCAPTRAMLMTGVDNHVAGIGSMRELMPLSHRGKPGYDGVLNQQVLTVAQLLKAQGYRTSVSGKWHLGVQDDNLPPARGFDDSFIQADNGADNYEMRPYLPMRPEARWYDNGKRLQSLPDDFYSSTAFMERTLQFLRSAKEGEQPFFTYIAFQANHTPIQVPARFADAYRGRYSEGWPAVYRARIERIRTMGLVTGDATLDPGPAPEDWNALTPDEQYFEARRMQVYAGMASAMDYEIGRLIRWLKDAGLYDNTVFVVLSDNGATTSDAYDNAVARRWLDSNYHRDVETLGEKGSWIAPGRYWGRVSNAPFAGQKFSASEGGMRVPLIIADAAQPQANAVQHTFAHVTDIAPTLLELAGWRPEDAPPATQAMSGRSLVPLLGPGDMPPAVDRAPVGYEFCGNAALFQGDYKILRNLPPAGDGRWRLFDIVQDPGETLELGEAEPVRLQAMLEAYEAYTREAGVLPMPEDYALGRQVMINAVLFFYLPRYAPWIAGFVLLLLGGFLLLRRRRAAG